jgi:phytoene dehydrogenase-like protein
MTKALEKTYDGIVIGAGHHGLILGSYLAKAGLRILLVDRRLQYGGGLCTREVTEPGFYHYLHSINHFHTSETTKGNQPTTSTTAPSPTTAPK